MNHADVRHVDFSDAIFKRANLSYAWVEKARFDNAQLQGTSLDSAQLQGASLDGAQLQGASLNYAQLQGASLYGPKLQGASLNYAQLQGASLYGAKLQGASLNYAQLQGALFLGTDLQGASLNYAQLQGVSFAVVQSGDKKWISGDLEGASLNHAQLQGASLAFANMAATRMNGAFVWRTQFPDDFPRSSSASELRWRPEFSDADGDKISPWTSTSYDALRQDLRNVIPEGHPLTAPLKRIEITDILKRIEILDCKTDQLASCDPTAKPPDSVEALRKKIEGASIDEHAYQIALASSLGALVCKAEGDTIYILRGLSRDREETEAGAQPLRFGEFVLYQYRSTNRIQETGPEAPKLAARFMSPECPVSTALTDEDKARLRGLMKPATPAPSEIK